jgi:hydroxymethylpyrimidine/phosphomethylpyrimidine kinase
MPPTPCALAISGLDPSGGAGLFADLRAFAAASAWGCGAVAVVTVQSTAGLRSSYPVASQHLTEQVRELFRRQTIRSVKTGALGSRENVAAVRRLLRGPGRGVPLVVDPVMRSTLGRPSARLLDEDARRELLGLVGAATVVTPNVTEAELLLGIRIRSLADAEGAAHALVELGARAALVKGGHLASNGHAREVTDVLALGDKTIILRSPRVATDVHGTGCTLASLIAGRLAHAEATDDVIVRAVRWAKQRLRRSLERPLCIGAGQLVVSP